MGSSVTAFVWRDVVGQRWIRCAVWQAVISFFVWLALEFVFNSLWLNSRGSSDAVVLFPFLWAFIRSLLFQASQLFFVLGQTFISYPEERDSASIGDLAGGLATLAVVAVAGRSRDETAESDIAQLRNRIRTTLDHVWFAAMCLSSGFLAFLSIVPSVQLSSGGPSSLEIGLRGGALGLIYAASQFYLHNLSLQFPTIQRGLFFAFKMGIHPAAKASLKLALVLLPLGEISALIIPSKGVMTNGNRSFSLGQLLIFGTVSFFVAFCWELGHYIIQVLHSKHYTFAPPLGSAAAETGPSDLLLMVLEDPGASSLVQYHAYLDLCTISETNVDTWRRAAIFEETGDTYARLIRACLKKMDGLTLRLVQYVDLYQGNKSLDLSKYQMQYPQASNDKPSSHPASSRNHFLDFQLCTWCVRTVASLTSNSRFEDKYGVAQLHGCNIAVVSSLLSCLLVIEVYLGRRSNAHSVSFVPNSIKWTVPSRGAFMEAGKRRGNPFGKRTAMHKKAYAMADVLRTSLYQIVSVFGDEMMQAESGGSGYAGGVVRDWLRQKKPLYGAYEMHIQKLKMFIDCRV